jgi:hypothetical protein
MAHLKVKEPRGKAMCLSAYYTHLKKKKINSQPSSDGSNSWEAVQMKSPSVKLTKLDVDWVTTLASPVDTIQEKFDSVEVMLKEHHRNLT